MFSNNLIAGVSGQSSGGYTIDDSLRFNDNDSAYLSRTPSVAGNRKTWTWSGWVKRGNLGSRQFLFTCADVNAQNSLYFEFSNNDEINIADYNTNWVWQKTTTGVFRDVSGWYHIVLRYDTTESTASDRIKLYVNGAQVTAFGTNTDPSLNYDGFINTTTNPHRIGSINAVSLEFDGYMAEVNFIDGQALTADDFGQIDASTGEWSPKRYSGTYGTNGFYLAFEDGSALGDDTSGNTNDWTPVNLASTDQMLDTPTNNFATLNSTATTMTLSEGNLKETTNVTSNWQSAISTIGVSSGKWYFETCSPTVLSGPPYAFIGITTDPNFGTKSGGYLGDSADSWGYIYNGDKYTSATNASYGSGYTNGDVIGCALDMDAGTVTFYKNNVSQGVAFTALTGTMFCGASVYTNSGTASNNINFGQDSSFAGSKTRQGNTDANGIGDFYYTPPAGYLALCTDNLPAPAIEQPETQFNVVTYTGNSSSNSITGVGFQPDFVWIKNRTTSASHGVFDSVRGDYKILFPNETLAEITNTNNVALTSDGFDIAGGSTTLNGSGNNYVAWCWKAGGTAVTNTDGSITSQVSANVDAGFSVATYTGNSSTGTIGHGLSKKPELVIIKNRNYSSGAPWYVGSPSFGTNNYLQLNSTSAMLNYVDGSGGAFFNYGGWSDSVVNVYNQNSTDINSSSYSYVMYSFHSVEGFSKIGTYVGNGSADGPFIYTGFKPAFVMFKRTDSTGSWLIYDNARQGYNLENDYIYVNSANAEANGGSNGIDFLSNGIKLRNTYNDANTSGATYIYMAFAEAPFNNSLAR